MKNCIDLWREGKERKEVSLPKRREAISRRKNAKDEPSWNHTDHGGSDTFPESRNSLGTGDIPKRKKNDRKEGRKGGQLRRLLSNSRAAPSCSRPSTALLSLPQASPRGNLIRWKTHLRICPVSTKFQSKLVGLTLVATPAAVGGSTPFFAAAATASGSVPGVARDDFEGRVEEEAAAST